MTIQVRNTRLCYLVETSRFPVGSICLGVVSLRLGKLRLLPENLNTTESSERSAERPIMHCSLNSRTVSVSGCKCAYCASLLLLLDARGTELWCVSVLLRSL